MVSMSNSTPSPMAMPPRVQPASSRAPMVVSAWVALLVAIATLLGLALMASGSPFGNPWLVVALSLSAALAERQRIRLSSTIEESISLVPILFTAVLFGPLPSMLVGAASYASH